MAMSEHIKKAKAFLALIIGKEKNKTVNFIESDKTRPFLHISCDNRIPLFIPRVTDRSGEGEDVSVPRVCGAFSIWACMSGYASVHHDFTNGDNGDIWKGGYQIYKLPYRVCIEPTLDLVPVVDRTQEKWIIPYDTDHNTIKPIRAGKLYIKERLTERRKQGLYSSYTMYLHVTDGPLPLHGDVFLENGYYRLHTARDPEQACEFPYINDVFNVSREEYQSNKQVSAGLLSYQPDELCDWAN